jgi:hypothetical protein
MYIVTIKSDTENYTERYEDLIDAANAFANECGGEELTSVCNEAQSVSGHCVGDGQEVMEDFELFGNLMVKVPECEYLCILKSDRRFS